MTDDGDLLGGPRPTTRVRHDARGVEESNRLARARWRPGRRVPRNVYAMLGREAGDYDVLIGHFDSAVLAAEAVDAHNVLRRLV